MDGRLPEDFIIPDDLEDSVTLLYSGGDDSTYIAARLLMGGRRVHLLTFLAPYLIFQKSSQKRVASLQARYGAERVSVDTLDIMPSARRILFAKLVSDFADDRLLCACVGCKLAMHAGTIIFNSRRGIKSAFTGNVLGQTYDQSAEMIAATAKLYQSFGMRLVEPILESGSERRLAFGENNIRKAQIEMLRAEGLIEAERAFDQPRRFFGSQPFCLLGKSAWVLAGLNQDRLQSAVGSYLERHLPLVYEFIEKETGIKRLR